MAALLPFSHEKEPEKSRTSVSTSHVRSEGGDQHEKYNLIIKNIDF